MKKRGPCCGELHMDGVHKGYGNTRADRVPDFKLKGHYGGPEGGHNEATETEADERREHGD